MFKPTVVSRMKNELLKGQEGQYPAGVNEPEYFFVNRK
jgi:hypothetical protein